MRRLVLSLALASLVSSAGAEPIVYGSFPFHDYCNLNSPAIGLGFDMPDNPSGLDLIIGDVIVIDFSPRTDYGVSYDPKSHLLAVSKNGLSVYAERLKIDDDACLFVEGGFLVLGYSFSDKTMTRRVSLDEDLLADGLVKFLYDKSSSVDFQSIIFDFLKDAYQQELFNDVSVSSKR